MKNYRMLRKDDNRNDNANVVIDEVQDALMLSTDSPIDLGNIICYQIPDLKKKKRIY